MGAVLHRILDEVNQLGGNREPIIVGRHICNVLMGHPYASGDVWGREFDRYIQKHFSSLATASTQPAKEDDSSTSEEGQEDDGSTEFKRQKDWQKEQLDKINAVGQEVT